MSIRYSLNLSVCILSSSGARGSETLLHVRVIPAMDSQFRAGAKYLNPVFLLPSFIGGSSLSPSTAPPPFTLEYMNFLFFMESIRGIDCMHGPASALAVPSAYDAMSSEYPSRSSPNTSSSPFNILLSTNEPRASGIPPTTR